MHLRISLVGRVAPGLCLVAAAMIWSPAFARANSLIWTLNGVTFNDTGVAVGTFTYNADTGTVSAWNISVAGGNTLLFADFTYTPANSTFKFVTSTFDFQGPLDPAINPSVGAFRELRLNPASPLTDAGGNIALNSGGFGSVECYNCSPFRDIVSGTVSATPTAAAEPSALLLTGIGLVGLTVLLRRRSAAIRASRG